MEILLFLATLLASFLATNQNHISSVTRHYRGDLYSLTGGSGTENFSPEHECACGFGSSRVGPLGECQCQCDSDKPAFRVDTVTCVDDLQECLLVELVSPTDVDKIPYVYIPLQGELIHPTAEISLLGLTQDDSPLVSPACVATNSHVLTETGWKEIGNSSKFETPVKLHRDFGKTFLQWTGGDKDKDLVAGRLLLVHMLCRDSAFPEKPLFSPCVALRVAGSPGVERRMGHAMISEVTVSEGGLTFHESLTLGLVLGFLFLAYIVASIVYMRFRRNKNVKTNSKTMEEGFTVPVKSTNISTLPQGHRRSKRFFQKTSLVSSEDDSDFEDIEDLSNINKGRSTESTPNDVGFTTAVIHDYTEDEDIYSVASEAEELEGRRQRMERIKEELHNGSLKRQQADKILEQELHGKRHGQLELSQMDFQFPLSESRGQTAQQAFQAPALTSSEPQVENMTNFQNKKKLYFNPSYLNMDQLQNPSPDALDFIARIREMIAVAKSKLKMKEFKPTLISIPENEDAFQGSRPCSSLSTSRPSSCLTVRIDEIDTPTSKNSQHAAELHHNRKSPIHFDSSTLERLSRRVNTHGETLVSQLKRTLDLKPRVPDAFFLPPTHKGLISLSLASAQLQMNDKKPAIGETEFPELIKPSLVKETVHHSEINGNRGDKFEDIRHEMQITLNKAKCSRSLSLRVASPAENLTRNGKTSSSVSYADDEKNKVASWLQSLEMKDKGSIASEQSDCTDEPLGIKSTLSDMVQNEVGPGLYSASLKFNSLKRPIKQSSSLSVPKKNEALIKQETIDYVEKEQNIIQANTSTNDEGVDDFITEAQTKIPKLFPSDSDSNQYDSLPKSSKIGSSTHRNKDKTSLMCPGWKSDDEDDHAYEEIQFANSLAKHKPRRVTKEHVKEIQVPAEETDEDGRCSIYSNPESLVSEIQISNEQVVTKHSSGSVLSIEVNKSDTESGKEENNNSLGKGKRRRRKVKRNDSIMQDSLERPKVKKKSSQIEETETFTKGADQKSSPDDIKVRRSKTLRTFKDYHDMKLFRSSNPSLTLAEPGINLNFLQASSKANDRPPLPPKLLKSMEDIPSIDVEGRTSNLTTCDETVPTVPPKFRLHKSKSFNETNSLHYHVSDIPILPPKTKNKPLEDFPELPPKLKKTGLNEEEDAPPKLPEKKPQGQLKTPNYNPQDSSPFLSQVQADDNVNKQCTEPSTNSIHSQTDASHKTKNKIANLEEENGSHIHNQNERVRGEFILSNNKTPSLCRQKSLPRDGNLLSAIQKIVAELGDTTNTKGSLLENRIKGDLEQHFKEKSDADNIKRTWAFIMEKLNSSEGKLSVQDLQTHLSELNKSETDGKYKQEDSGYQSTDSSDSSKIIHNRLRKSLGVNNMKSHGRPSREQNENSDPKRPPIFFQRSFSLQHLLPDNFDSQNTRLKRNLSTASLHKKSMNPKLSVYVNDKFS